MTVKAAPWTQPDTYLRRVREFPLLHIRDDRHLKAAIEVMDGLLCEDLDEGSREYLDALTDLIGAYEDANVAIPDASPEDVLRELMAANRLTQKALAEAVGIAQSSISDVLRGQRQLTRRHIQALAKHFHIAPAAFLPRA